MKNYKDAIIEGDPSFIPLMRDSFGMTMIFGGEVERKQAAAGSLLPLHFDLEKAMSSRAQRGIPYLIQYSW